MRTFCSIFLGLIGFSCSVLQAQSIKDLELLIGRWEHEETIFPGTDKEYTESGTRQCDYVLGGTYIKCESKSIGPKGERTYWFLINYNKGMGNFQVISFFSDYNFNWKYTWYLDKENQQIRAISETKSNAKQFFRSFLKLAKDKIVWEGYRSRFTEDLKWILEFREVSKRIER